MEKERGQTILTTMIMLYRKDGTFLVEDRKKQDWPGINFPGGHVEVNESIVEGAIRECQEETGLIVDEIEECGYFEWNLPSEKTRHLCLLFRSSSFHGEIHSSREGEVFFLSGKDLQGRQLSTDFLDVLAKMKKGL